MYLELVSSESVMFSLSSKTGPELSITGYLLNKQITLYFNEKEK